MLTYSFIQRFFLRNQIGHLSKGVPQGTFLKGYLLKVKVFLFIRYVNSFTLEIYKTTA